MVRIRDFSTRPIGRRTPFILVTAVLAACSAGPDILASRPGAPGAQYQAIGHVDFGQSDRDVAVTINEIAVGATVSLIDPGSGNTIGTTLTNSKGDFVLTFGETFKPDTGPYFFEAVKGIGPTNRPNQVGYPTIRVRTLGSFQGGWKSLSPGNFVVLNRSTTALCALSSLKNLDATGNLALLGALTLDQKSTDGSLESKDTYSPKGGISNLEYLRAVDLVNQVLNQNEDPIGSLFLRPAGAQGPASESGHGYGMHPGLAWAADGAAIAKLDVSAASIGQDVTVYGQGFPTQASLISANLGTVPCAVTAVSSTEFKFKVPQGATGGMVTVRIGRWTLTSPEALGIN